MDMPVF